MEYEEIKPVIYKFVCKIENDLIYFFFKKKKKNKKLICINYKNLCLIIIYIL